MIQICRIKAYEIGLKYRNNRLVDVLSEGRHLVRFTDQVDVYDMTKRFTPEQALEILLGYPLLAERLQMVEVGEQQLALQFDNGQLTDVLKYGQYAFWKGVVSRAFQLVDIGSYVIDAAVDARLFQHASLMAYIREFRVEAYEKAVLLVDGKYAQILEAGVYRYWRNQQSIELRRLDMRMLQMEIPGQEMLTNDKATLRMNGHIQYKVQDIYRAVMENKDFEKQLYVQVQMAFRALVGALSLDELLEKKGELSEMMLQDIQREGDVLGLTILSCGVKDIILPGEMRDIMNQVLMAEKKAQANVIMRREETASTRSLLNTAKLMEENEMLWKLKEMEYIERISEKINQLNLSGGSLLSEQLKELFLTKK